MLVISGKNEDQTLICYRIVCVCEKNRLETMIYLYSLFYIFCKKEVKRTDGFITVTSFGDILIFDVAADDQIL